MMEKRESGQALVLVLLSLSVVLTLVLFILSRSITDVSVSSNQSDSIRAFSAAEAGVEQALVVGSGSSSPIGNAGASYKTSVTPFALGGYDIPFPSPLASGDIATVWFTSHDTNGNLACNPSATPSLPCFTGNTMKICWGNPGATFPNPDTTPAIELSVYYEIPAGSLANLYIARALIDPDNSRQSANPNIMPPDNSGTCTVGNQTYKFEKTITFSSLGVPAGSYTKDNGLQFAKIKMLYNDTPHLLGVNVNFSGNTTLPSQGQRIDSSGAAGNSNRRIVVYQGWAVFPFASNSVFSPVGITK